MSNPPHRRDHPAPCLYASHLLGLGDDLGAKPCALLLVAAYDPGSNFGRVARVGVMDDYVDGMMRQTIAGVPAKEWISFFKKYERSPD